MSHFVLGLKMEISLEIITGVGYTLNPSCAPFVIKIGSTFRKKGVSDTIFYIYSLEYNSKMN